MFGHNDLHMAPLQSVAVNNQLTSPNVPTNTAVPNAAAISGVGTAASGAVGQTIPSGLGAQIQGLFGEGFFQPGGGAEIALGGVQTIGSLWNAYQQNRLARESIGLQRDAYNTNLENQTTSYNTALEDRIRARYATEGRSSGEADKYIERNSL